MTWGRDTDAEEAATQLVAFVEAGGALVDTADVYGEGEAERILGGLLADVIPLGTRWYSPPRRSLAATRDRLGGGASRGALLTALEGSLRRLQTDHVDLWQLHAWDPGRARRCERGGARIPGTPTRLIVGSYPNPAPR